MKLKFFSNMQVFYRNTSYLMTMVLIFIFERTNGQFTDVIWFNKPADFFEESIVLGNGKIGATVHGGVTSEKIYLNDATLWSGEPVDPYMNPEAYKHLPAIREALFKEDYRLADSLNKKLQGKFSHSYAPLGTLYIDFQQTGTTNVYRRELNLNQAVSRTVYEIDGCTYFREYLVSYPDKIMAIKLSASKPKSLSFRVRFTSLLKYRVTAKENMLQAIGFAPIYAAPSYFGDVPNAVIFDSTRGTRFISLIHIKNADGSIKSTDSTIEVKNASTVTIFVTTETSFNGFDKDPVKYGKKFDSIAYSVINQVKSKSFEEIKNTHIADYQKYYNRLKLDLMAGTPPNLPTDLRLKRYAEGKEDKQLEILYFNFGRYLLISSSRTPEVPANLQGIWNPYMRPPWSSNYTMNINLEENYWPAEIANLSEMHWPLLSFIKNLAHTGQITAKTFYGVDKGWAACHNSDIWAMSNPVGNFGTGDPSWANWNMGGTWLSTHLWDHYLFTQDTGYLFNFAYPLLKGAAEFCLGWLVEDKNGYMVTAPSTSPENRYITPNGYIGATLYGSTADLAMIRACFKQFIKASELIGADADLRQQIELALQKLYPYKIGRKGNLQEWYHDWGDEDTKHRHQSHLFGLYPGNEISVENTPDLAAACRKTLEIKGDETTGWSMGWRINLWARLGDGNRAYQLYRKLLRYTEPDGLRPNYGGGGGTYPNLFDAHPPFQIDGNFGGTAAVIEMLVQSTENEIILLPALPDAWATGSIKGVRCRGGFEVSFNWQKKRVKKVTIKSIRGGETVVVIANSRFIVKLGAGEQKTIKYS